MTSADQSDVKIYKASKILQSKVGSGTIERTKVAACQSAMDANKTNFEPMARQLLEQMEEAVRRASAPESDLDSLRQTITSPVMQIKANASMFGYPLAGDLANIMLSFIENATRIDRNMLEIVDAHRKTLDILIRNRIKGDGGEVGRKMKAELLNACKRYLEKKAKKIG